MGRYDKPKNKTIDGIKWVTITQIEDPPRKIEWACGQWGAVRVVRGEHDESWSITYIHRVEATGYESVEKAMSDAAALVREVARRRIADAKDRGARKAEIRELEKRAAAVSAP